MKSSFIKYFILGFFLIFPLLLSAFPSDSLKFINNEFIGVDSIKIIGNETTEEYIILRELTFKAGEEINKTMLVFNRERVFSLGIFNQVEMYPEFKSELTNIVISVKESWYIYPIPFFWLRENSLAKSSYGMNFLYKNFRGRNETLGALLSFGYDPVYSISYFNPVLIEDEEISLRLAFAYQTMQNRNLYAEYLYGERFDYKAIGGLVGLGYRIDQFHSISWSLGYDYIRAPQNEIAGITAGTDNTDNVFSSGIGYAYDSRNLKQFSDDGIYTSIGLVHKGFGIDGVNYNILGIDFREYRSAFDLFTGRWRVAFRHAFGKLIPFYDFSYLGYSEIIRGHSREDREGYNYLVSSVELNFPIVKEWNVSLKLPIIPQKLTSARIGVHLSVFGDTGTTFGRGDALALSKFDSGWGFGLIILFLPYNAVRFEYAFDEYRNGEFILGTGFSF